MCAVDGTGGKRLNSGYLTEECVNQGRYHIAVISGEKVCMSRLGKKKTI